MFVALIGFTSCGEDFLTALPTEKQAAGGSATEGAILSNLGSAYQILLFDSYANNNYNSIPLMSDLRSDDITRVAVMPVTSISYICYHCLQPLLPKI